MTHECLKASCLISYWCLRAARTVLPLLLHEHRTSWVACSVWHRDVGIQGHRGCALVCNMSKERPHESQDPKGSLQELNSWRRSALSASPVGGFNAVTTQPPAVLPNNLKEKNNCGFKVAGLMHYSDTIQCFTSCCWLQSIHVFTLLFQFLYIVLCF